METLDEVLAHYGVRGMRWGVRRSAAELSGPQPVTIDAKPGKKIQTSGGKGQPVSDDAKLAAVYRQKAKASGPQSLSNAEMQTIVTRMNLEQQYMKLNPKQVSLGEKFLKEYAPVLALEGSKAYYKDSKDPNVQMGLQFGETLVKEMNKAKTKKK